MERDEGERSLGRSFVFKRVDLLVCLGVALDRHGSTSASLSERLAAAIKHWHARPELRARSIAPRKRMQRFYDTVMRTLLWGSGGWELTQNLAKRLLCFESRCLRQILGRRRRDGESWIQYIQLATRAARVIVSQSGFRTVLESVALHIWRWSGHAARLAPHFHLVHAIWWKSMRWWRTQQVLMGALDPQNETGWRHTSWREQPRWEEQVSGFLWRRLVATCTGQNFVAFSGIRVCAGYGG